MKALEYPKGRSADGTIELLKSRLNSKGQIVLRERDVQVILAEREFLLAQARALSRLPSEVKMEVIAVPTNVNPDNPQYEFIAI